MSFLKQVIKYDNANAIEATWVDESDAVIRCHSYADVQMQMFRDDVAQYGGNIEDYEALISEVEAAIVPPQSDPIVIPQSVTMRQARLALHAAGKLALVDAAIDAMPEPPRTAARIEWDYSNEVNRNNVFIAGLASAIGMTAEEVDQLFITAATL